MSKHSKATQALVSFSKENSWLNVVCRDNGVGLSDTDKKGKGLANTVSRIERLNGSVIFDPQAAKGFCIRIQLPLASS